MAVEVFQTVHFQTVEEEYLLENLEVEAVCSFEVEVLQIEVGVVVFLVMGSLVLFKLAEVASL